MTISYWNPEGTLSQKLHICITEVIAVTMLQEIPNMDKGIQLSLFIKKKYVNKPIIIDIAFITVYNTIK